MPDSINWTFNPKSGGNERTASATASVTSLNARARTYRRRSPSFLSRILSVFLSGDSNQRALTGAVSGFRTVRASSLTYPSSNFPIASSLASLANLAWARQKRRADDWPAQTRRSLSLHGRCFTRWRPAGGPRKSYSAARPRMRPPRTDKPSRRSRTRASGLVRPLARQTARRKRRRSRSGKRQSSSVDAMVGYRYRLLRGQACEVNWHWHSLRNRSAADEVCGTQYPTRRRLRSRSWTQP